jgi:hypothetical protein
VQQLFGLKPQQMAEAIFFDSLAAFITGSSAAVGLFTPDFTFSVGTIVVPGASFCLATAVAFDTTALAAGGALALLAAPVFSAVAAAFAAGVAAFTTMVAAFGALTAVFPAVAWFFLMATYAYFPDDFIQASVFLFFVASVLASLPGCGQGPQATPAFSKTWFKRPLFGNAWK